MLEANLRQQRRSWKQAMGRLSQTALNEWQKAFCEAWLIIGVDSSLALARGGYPVDELFGVLVQTISMASMID